MIKQTGGNKTFRITKKVVVIIGAVVLCIAFFSVKFILAHYKEAWKGFKHDPRIAELIEEPIRDLSTNDTKDILALMGLVIPEEEENIYIKTFGIYRLANTNVINFFVELDGIGDRIAFLEQNKPVVPTEVEFSRRWDMLYVNGMYRYYPSFEIFVLGNSSKDYIEPIRSTYNSIKRSTQER